MKIQGKAALHLHHAEKFPCLYINIHDWKGQAFLSLVVIIICMNLRETHSALFREIVTHQVMPAVCDTSSFL